MLKSISIKNYVLIDELNISFNSGFSVITGETGAGKTILVDGISLLLGKRADLSVNRDKTKKCVIEGIFDIGAYNLKPIFDVNELDYDSETILRREISPSGKSRAFINDSPVNLHQLSKIGSRIIDIHTQHQNLNILNQDFQFEIIDAFSNNNEIVDKFQIVFYQYHELHRKIEKLKLDKENLNQSIDYNKFILNELDSANLFEENLEELEKNQVYLSNFEVISEELSLINNLLIDENIGIQTNIQKLLNSLSKISGKTENLNNLYQRVLNISTEFEDVNQELNEQFESLENNPEKLSLLIQKIDTVNTLLRKHSVNSIKDLKLVRDEFASKVDSTESIDEKIEEFEKKFDDLKDKLSKISKSITKNRTDAIPKFITDIELILKDLGMENAKFKIELKPSNNFNSFGLDDINFMFQANRGYEFKDLKSSASGGEMSRIMLAVKSIIAKYRKIPSIIFDEIDTGVSGAISQKMGHIMKSLSKYVQTFSITHIPQIAAMGSSHYKIYKYDEDNITKTTIIKLTEEERIVEIAKMLEGSSVSESAINHAKRLMN
ncbi:MAG: DNA repair protein RecN [Flavobacteriaceae bacterium]